MSDEPSLGAPGPNDQRPRPARAVAVDEDVLGAWALGALDAEEQQQVDAAIAADRGLAQRAAQMEEVVAVLGSSVSAAPPPAMRARVLAALDDVPQVAAPVRADDAPAPRREEAVPAGVGDLGAARRRREQQPTRRTALRGLAVAAAGAVVGAAGVGAWLSTRRDPQSFDAVRARIDAAPDATTVAASDASGVWARTQLRYSESVGEAVVVSPQPLPAPSGGVYQLWRQSTPDAAPTPLEPFEGGDGVVVAGGAAGAVALAVSREGGPGATSPTTPVLAHYFLDA